MDKGFGSEFVEDAWIYITMKYHHYKRRGNVKEIHPHIESWEDRDLVLACLKGNFPVELVQGI